MNHFKQIAEMLGVEPEEEFKVKCKGGIYFTDSKYRLTEDGLNEVGTTWFAHGIFADILSGKAEIVKLPWKPKTDEIYYYYSPYAGITCQERWINSASDYCMWKLGNCFRTKAEAETKGKEIIEQIKKEYDKS